METLLITFNEAFHRVSMHGVRQELLLQQAEAIKIPVHEIWLPNPCPDEEYAKRMEKAVRCLRGQGLEYFAFGDIFLQDVKEYRERHLAKIGAKPIFPLWGLSTAKLAKEFIALRFKAIVVCVDSKKLGRAFLGTEFNDQFLTTLPENVDPCGEKGEFHTFVYDGPLFSKPVVFKRWRHIKRDGFWFQDLLPVCYLPHD